jgi:hypothetical protein
MENVKTTVSCHLLFRMQFFHHPGSSIQPRALCDCAAFRNIRVRDCKKLCRCVSFERIWRIRGYQRDQRPERRADG